MRRIVAFVVLFTALSFPASVCALEWGPSGLLNPDQDRPFMKVEADPTHPDIVWALTAHIPYPNPDFGVHDANGLYRSVDRGETWVQMNDTLLTPDIPVYDIAIDPTNPFIIYVGTNTLGILKSMDGGTTWQLANNGISYNGLSFPESRWAVVSVEINPVDPQIIYASVIQAYGIELEQGAGEHPGLYKSTDSGVSWIERNDGLPDRSDPFGVFDLVSHTSAVWSICILEQFPNIVLLGLVDMEINANLVGDKIARSGPRVFYSTNGGESGWSEASGGFPLIEEDRDEPYVFGRISLSFTTLAKNCGSDLVFIVSHVGATSIAIIYPEFDTDTVTRSAGVYRRSPQSPWEPINAGLPVANDDENINSINANQVCVSPVNPDIMLAGLIDADSGDSLSDASNVYLSYNGGNTWRGQWANGLSESAGGYTEASPFYIDINIDQTTAYASVRWDFDPDFFSSYGTEDDGIYRLPPLEIVP